MSQTNSTLIQFTYKNWRGETSVRTVVPLEIHWDRTEWHPNYQWLLKAFDREKGQERDFALVDIVGIDQGAIGEAMNAAPNRTRFEDAWCFTLMALWEDLDRKGAEQHLREYFYAEVHFGDPDHDWSPDAAHQLAINYSAECGESHD